MRIGALAGLSGKEREEAIRREAEKFSSYENVKEKSMRFWYIEAQPVASLAEILPLLSFHQLSELAVRYNLIDEEDYYTGQEFFFDDLDDPNDPNSSGNLAGSLGNPGTPDTPAESSTPEDEAARPDSEPSRAELEEKVLETVLETRENVPYSLLAGSDAYLYDHALAVYRAGGMCSIPLEENEARPLLERHCASVPYLFTFVHDGQITSVMPQELLQWTEDEDWEEAWRFYGILRRARKFAESYIELCGVIAVSELSRLYNKHLPNDWFEDEFVDFLYQNGPDEFTLFDIWTYGGVDYLIHWGFIEEEYKGEIGGGLRINGDKARTISDEESFRRYLVEAHRGKDPWEPAIGVFERTGKEECYDYYREIEHTPGYVAMRNYFDAHVPEDANEYFFADRVLEELVECVQYEFRPNDILDVAEEFGIEFESVADANEFLGLYASLANGIPHWANNGWSPLGLLEFQTGKKLFLDKLGVPIEVGRNDPCPCGSGLKYKKCCGR